MPQSQDPKAGAESGTLIFIVGGEEAAIEKLKPLFAATGKKIFRMGETGKGASRETGHEPANCDDL